jgi:hypothetical protein
MMEPKSIVAQDLVGFNDVEASIWAIARQFAVEITQRFLADLDDRLAADRPAGLRHKGYRVRRLVTVFGEVEMRRRYYADRAGKARFLIDEHLGLDPRRRLSEQVRRVARRLCCELTYRRASGVLEDLLGVRIEAQTGHSLVQELGQEIESDERELVEAVLEARVAPEPGERRSPFLCVEADGVHIRLQREGKRKGAEIKLGVAYDGWRTKANRTEVANKLVYGYLGSGTDFWDRFGLQVNSEWDLSAARRIVVGGDGAEWLEQGTSMFPGSEFQLDQYHLRRRVSAVLGHGKLARLVGDGLVGGRWEIVEGGLALAEQHMPDKTREIAELRLWARASRDKLKDYRLRGGFVPEGARGTGAIEGNVDKNVANRFKKRGRGWTIRGANNLVQVMNHQRRGRLDRPGQTSAASQILATAEPLARRKVIQGLELSGRGPRAGVPLLRHGANGASYTAIIRDIISRGGLPTFS